MCDGAALARCGEEDDAVEVPVLICNFERRRVDGTGVVAEVRAESSS